MDSNTKLLSDYDRKGLTSREQIAMATLRAFGIRGTEDMKATAKKIVAQLDKENGTADFDALVADLDLGDTPEV